jgi:hypothetical protein
MIVFLDANPVIHFIEQPAVWGTVSTARIAALRVAGHLLAVSDLVRMECQVGPLKASDAVRLNAFPTFFNSQDVNILVPRQATC